MSVWSVSQRLLPILSGGVTRCLLDQPKSFLPMSVVLPVSVMKNLLISVWIELACLLCQCLLVSSIDVCLKCFPTSFANLSEGITWCLPGSTLCLSCKRLSNGFDQCLSELVLTCLFLPMSIMRNLLMSFRTELACLLADVFLVSSINVLPEVFPNVFCQSV